MCLSTDKAEKGMGKYEDNDKWVPELGFTYQELAMIHGLKSGFASFTFQKLRYPASHEREIQEIIQHVCLTNC